MSKVNALFMEAQDAAAERYLAAHPDTEPADAYEFLRDNAFLREGFYDEPETRATFPHAIITVGLGLIAAVEFIALFGELVL